MCGKAVVLDSRLQAYNLPGALVLPPRSWHAPVIRVGVWLTLPVMPTPDTERSGKHVRCRQTTSGLTVQKAVRRRFNSVRFVY